MKRLLKVIDEVKCPKNQKNSFGNYNYRSCEDILVAVKPLLVKEGLLLTLTDDIIATEGGRYYIGATATVYDAETKEVIQQTRAFAREPDEKKGTDPSQISGTASSYARKYCLNGLLLLDDNKDADTNEYHIENEKKAKASAPKTVGSKQLKELADLCAKTGKLADVQNHYKIKNLADLTEDQGKEAIATLKKYTEKK